MDHLTVRKINSSFLQVETTSSVHRELSEFFKFRVPGFQFMPAYKNKLWDGFIRLYKSMDGTLYAGLLQYLKVFCHSRNYTIDIDPELEKFNSYTREDIKAHLNKLLLPFDVREYQMTAILHAGVHRRALLVSPTGCHTYDTEVILFSGETKNVQDIQVGDLLMGVDNTPRNVLRTIKGFGKIYNISSNSVRTKKFQDFEVNEDHILSLIHTKTSAIVNISVREYLVKSKYWKHCHKLYWNNKAIEFPKKQKLLIDPYVMGAYLGDGYSRIPAVTSSDNIMLEYVANYVQDAFCNTPNKFAQLMREEGINIGDTLRCENKHIPLKYKISSVKERLSLLAGLLDADGRLNKAKSYFSYTSKSKQLAEDVAYIARSLGFFVKIRSALKCVTNTLSKTKRRHYTCSITGNVSIIPTKLPRKRANVNSSNIHHNRHGFDVTYIKDDNFYGFELDQDHLYFLNNWCVTHNSGKSLMVYGLTRLIDKRTLIIVPTISLVSQMVADFRQYSAQDSSFNVDELVHPIYGGKEKETEKRIVISTWQSIYKLPKEYFEKFNVVFGDEVHLFKAKSLTTIMEKLVNAEYRFGTTGTLDGTLTHKLVLEGLFGSVFKVTTTKKLMDDKHLSELEIQCIVMKYDEETCKEKKSMNYHDEMKFITQNRQRNIFIRNLTLSMKSNTLVLFQYVKTHGKVLHQMIEDKMQKTDPTRKVFFVSGETKGEIREEIRQITETEKNAVIVASSGVFSTGINIRNLENIIFASPSKSRIRTLQSIGRALRIGDHSDKATLYDVIDDISYKTHKNFALKHFLERAKIYDDEKFKYKIHQIDLPSDK